MYDYDKLMIAISVIGLLFIGILSYMGHPHNQTTTTLTTTIPQPQMQTGALNMSCTELANRINYDLNATKRFSAWANAGNGNSDAIAYLLIYNKKC